MLRAHLLVVTCFAALMPAGPAAAQTQETAATSAAVAETSATRRAVSDWMMTYYKNPEPARVSEVLLAFDGIKDSGAIQFEVGFLSWVFEQNPEKIAAWVHDADSLSDSQRKVVWYAAWVSGTPEAQQVLLDVGSEKLTAAFKFDASSKRAMPADDRLLRSPSDLDFFWGRFAASGRPEPIQRIIATLPWQANKPITKPITAEEKAMFLRWAMGAAAQWALTSNASRQERVLEICKSELAKTSGPGRDYLEKIVNSAEKHRSAMR